MAYSRLYAEFGTGVFRLREAAEVLGADGRRARVLAHHLHRRGALLVFEAGRPRLYRLLSPENLILLGSGRVSRVSIRQERYVQLVYDVFRAVDGMVDLTSFAVYGSVARGEASRNSDLDVLVVSDSLSGSLGERVEFLLAGIRGEVRGELAFLRERGYLTRVSPYPLRRGEAEAVPLLMLDMVEDAAVVYDAGGFLAGVLDGLRRRLAELGARRVERGGVRYWDLKPDYRPMEVVEI